MSDQATTIKPNMTPKAEFDRDFLDFMRTVLMELRNHNPFFGVLATELWIAGPTQDVPTIGVSPKGVVVYNEEFMKKLPVGKLIAVLVHEALHVALDYWKRFEGHNPEIANWAHDFAINSIIIKGLATVHIKKSKGDSFTIKVELPDGGLYDSKYDNNSGEEIYHKLYDGVKERTKAIREQLKNAMGGQASADQRRQDMINQEARQSVIDGMKVVVKKKERLQKELGIWQDLDAERDEMRMLIKNNEGISMVDNLGEVNRADNNPFAENGAQDGNKQAGSFGHSPKQAPQPGSHGHDPFREANEKLDKQLVEDFQEYMGKEVERITCKVDGEPEPTTKENNLRELDEALGKTADEYVDEVTKQPENGPQGDDADKNPGDQANDGGNPEKSDQPGQDGTQPGEGDQPGQDGNQPGEGSQPGQDGNQPGEGNQPGQDGNQPGEGNQPGQDGNQPGEGNQPGQGGNQPGQNGGQPGQGQGQGTPSQNQGAEPGNGQSQGGSQGQGQGQGQAQPGAGNNPQGSQQSNGAGQPGANDQGMSDGQAGADGQQADGSGQPGAGGQDGNGPMSENRAKSNVADALENLQQEIENALRGKENGSGLDQKMASGQNMMEQGAMQQAIQELAKEMGVGGMQGDININCDDIKGNPFKNETPEKTQERKRQMLSQATRQDKIHGGNGWGCLPNWAKDEIEGILNPPLRLDQKIKKVIGNYGRPDSATFKRPNKRNSFREYSPLLPGKKKNSSRIYILMDTSGSMFNDTDKDNLRMAMGLVKRLASSKGMEVLVVQCDAGLQRVMTTKEALAMIAENKFEVNGGGGSDFTEGFEYIWKEIREKDSLYGAPIIVFTDGGITVPEMPPKNVPKSQTLWITTPGQRAPSDKWGEHLILADFTNR